MISVSKKVNNGFYHYEVYGIIQKCTNVLDRIRIYNRCAPKNIDSIMNIIKDKVQDDVDEIRFK